MKSFYTLLACALCTASAWAQTHQVTFEVNMANETVSPTGVYIAGGNYFGVPGDNPMTDPDGDGVYSITFELDEGFSGHYAFTNGACTDWGCKENLAGQPCADVTNYNDRFLEPVMGDTTISTCFAQCSTDGTCTENFGPIDVTFQVDMTMETVSGGVFITGGSIDNWTASTPMTDDDGDGIYSVTLNLAQGAHEYKFLIGGWGGEENFDPAIHGACTLTTGAFTNRLLIINSPEPIVLDVVCFNECVECTGDPVDPTTSDVTFSVDMSNEDILGPIYITGNTIDNWCGTCVEMLDDDADGVYTVTLPLGMGNHEFKYNNGGWDGQEMLDEVEDAECTLTTDGFTNRLVVVSDTLALEVPEVCFNSCAACETSSVEELSTWEFDVVPSVTDGLFTVRLGRIAGDASRMTVHRIDGGLVQELNIPAGSTTLTLDASSWEAGIYLIHCASPLNGGVQRLIKIQ